MAVQDIAYVELFARDKVPVVGYFVEAMGFTRVADSVEADRSSVLLRQGTTQLVVTSGRGVAGFLDRHGDGVADIALTCDDVAATWDAAVAAGAGPARTERGVPVVTGFGEVVHTLVPRSAGDLPAPPPGRRWMTAPGPSGGPEPLGDTAPPTAPGHVRLLDHVAVCIGRGLLEHHADLYRDGFGLDRYSSEYVALGAQAMDSIVVRSDSGHAVFTLCAPDPGTEPGQLDAFMERNGGPGVQHLAFLVDDIVGAVGAFAGRGMDFLGTPDTYYDMLAERFPEMRGEVAGLRKAQVLADRDEWGHLLQLFSRSPHERDTLFYELIQRRGSRGFGSANIRALYEAVERDRLAAG
ncbi:4-hydroxyphenylpyruvate dioxygenase [Actinomadura opuntiae]|uniref:4-hydroxyphenylpyruvate dioxygenase n=1 Tax=Actinomadura sp. OS1-43 TaxID=604315 RepID=UPI00255AF0EB|nr:4-hydroxyphenylpyruvate dioxygenase [Actinomadura sp. OS1-43]MDL4821049.1 4-hydroxyphenylpyruvate dioxygenase [Actinomadura sp. OS1-43]